MGICRSRLARATGLITIAAFVTTLGIGGPRGAVQAEKLSRMSVTVIADGEERCFGTSQTTVGAVLKEAGITLGSLDRVAPSPKDRVREGLCITVTRISERIVAETEPIPFETTKTFTKSLRPGQVKQTKQGQNGQRLLHYRVRWENGRIVSRTQVSSIVVKKPVNRVVAIGYRGFYASRGEFRTRKVLRMSASAYDPGPRSCGRYATGRTACGLKAGYGVVAVDTRVIPFGTRLYVEGYGYAIAGDRGRAIKGHRIDLGFDTYNEAIRFGRKRVIVHVLEE